MIKIFVTLCQLANPSICHETLATSTAYQPLGMFDCADQASLADWMKQHPAERVVKVRCQFGERPEHGA
jgi:hypothetical protein